MKICIISNFYPPTIIGGAEIVVQEIAKGLSAKGNKVTVITTSHCHKIEKKYDGEIKIISFFPINVYWLYYSKKMNFALKVIWHLIDLWNPYSYMMIRKILKKEKPDIVHSHNIDGFSPAVWSAVKSLSISLVHTMHDYHLICPRNTLLKGNSTICKKGRWVCQKYSAYWRKVSSKIDFITAPSEFLMHKIVEEGFFCDSGKRVIYNGLEMSVKERIKVKENIPIKSKKAGKNILFISNLEENKGISVLSKVIKKNTNTNLHFLIAGKGSQENKMKKELEGIKEVTFLGFMQDNKKKEIFQRADILFFPSICLENCPMVILEAYKYGLPVVGSAIGGVKELVQHGKTGFLFTPGNNKKAYQYICQLSQKQQTYTEMSENAFIKFEDFTSEKQINSYLKVYNEIQ